MTNKINAKLILELKASGLSRNQIATTRHMSKHSVRIVFEKELPVLLNESFYDRKRINLKFLVLRGMGIIESPLFERNISADKI